MAIHTREASTHGRTIQEKRDAQLKFINFSLAIDQLILSPKIHLYFLQYSHRKKLQTQFGISPLVKNIIGEFLSNTTSILGQSNTSLSKVANHSARKNSISTLLNNKTHPLHVIQSSGHKNTDSLNSLPCRIGKSTARNVLFAEQATRI